MAHLDEVAAELGAADAPAAVRVLPLCARADTISTAAVEAKQRGYARRQLLEKATSHLAGVSPAPLGCLGGSFKAYVAATDRRRVREACEGAWQPALAAATNAVAASRAAGDGGGGLAECMRLVHVCWLGVRRRRRRRRR